MWPFAGAAELRTKAAVVVHQIAKQSKLNCALLANAKVPKAITFPCILRDFQSATAFSLPFTTPPSPLYATIMLSAYQN